jgi:hypothetical protein
LIPIHFGLREPIALRVFPRLEALLVRDCVIDRHYWESVWRAHLQLHLVRKIQVRIVADVVVAALGDVMGQVRRFSTWLLLRLRAAQGPPYRSFICIAAMRYYPAVNFLISGNRSQ